MFYNKDKALIIIIVILELGQRTGVGMKGRKGLKRGKEEAPSQKMR